jgi:hypothetical protein
MDPGQGTDGLQVCHGAISSFLEVNRGFPGLRLRENAFLPCEWTNILIFWDCQPIVNNRERNTAAGQRFPSIPRERYSKYKGRDIPARELPGEKEFSQGKGCDEEKAFQHS